MNEETLNSYIESSKTVDSSVIYQVALMCGAFLILALITGLIVLFMLKKKRIREMEEVRNDKDYNSMTELERMEFKKNCINPAEQPEAVIGSRGLKQYLTKEDEIDGFSVVTNRRVYFKGKLFVRDEKGGIIPYDGEHTYDNYEIICANDQSPDDSQRILENYQNLFHTAIFSEFNYFRLMGKCRDRSHTIFEIEYLSVAVICCIHLLQTRISIQH